MEQTPLKGLKIKKKKSTQNLYPEKLFFKHEGKKDIFRYKKVKDIHHQQTALEDTLKDILLAAGKLFGRGKLGKHSELQ